MKRYKKLLVVALAAMPAAALQAQTYSDMVRKNTWTLYGAGGITGYNGVWGCSDSDIRTTIAPDLGLGVKYNIRPWVRVGLNLEYTKLKVINTNIKTTTETVPNFMVGNYSDGDLKRDIAVLAERHDQHFAGADLGGDFNMFQIFSQYVFHKAPVMDGRLNLWLGTGVGFLQGWDRHTTMKSYSEEAVNKGEDHFNIFTHDYIKTEHTSPNTSSLYIPARLSLEYDITPNWTVGVKGEYKVLPLDRKYAPKAMWHAGASIAYNFVRQPYGWKMKAIKSEKEIVILNEDVNTLRAENAGKQERIKQLSDDLTQSKKALQKAAETEAALRDSLNKEEVFSLNPVFFPVNSSKIEAEQMKYVNALAEILQKYPDTKIAIDGYASPEGNIDINNRLAEERAQAVADCLINNYGINPNRITTRGCGPTDQLYKTFSLNRVAQITITK